MERWEFYILILMTLLWWDLLRHASRMERRLRWLGSEIERLARSTDVKFDVLGWVPTEVVALIEKGEKSRAIRLLRNQEIGLSRKEAKEIAEAIGERTPEWWSARQQT